VTEKVVVRQNRQFEIGFWAMDPEDPESEELHQVDHIHQLTPYGMLLASLGSCTAIVLHTYSQHHDVDLQEVELQVSYARVFKEDCDNCEEIERYDERIYEEIQLDGGFSSAERDKLLHIAHQCSIYKMLQSGIQIESKEMG
jgi:putative redox protein